MRRHTQAGSPQASKLTTEFAERFGVFGPVDHCVSKLKAIVALGLDHLVIVGTSLGAPRDEAGVANLRFTDEILPALR
jgi:hypothetical protein